MNKKTPRPEHDLLRNMPAFKLFTDRVEHISRFREIYNTITTDPDEYFFMMYYGAGGIGKSALCDRLIDEFKELDGFNKNNKLNNFYAKINLDGGNYIHAENFLFELRYVIGNNAKKYNKVKFEFPIFDTCYSMFWKKRYKNIPLKGKAEKTGMGNILQEIASILLDSVTMGMGGLITEIAKIGIEKIKDKKQWENNDNIVFINRFSQLEAHKMKEYLPQALSIDIANNLNKNDNKQLLIFVDTYEAIYGEISMHVNTLQSKKLDLFFRELVNDIIKLSNNVSFFVFGREKIYWEEIDPSWEDIIDTHLIGKLSDNDAREFLENANIPANLIEHIVKKVDGYPLYLELSVNIYMNKVDDGEKVTKSDFPSGHRKLIDRFLKYTKNQDLFKELALARKWNKELFDQIINNNNINFNSLKKYSFISDNGEYLSMHSEMRNHIISYLLENEKQETVDLINKLIKYHSDFELKHPDDITPEILYHIEEKLYLEKHINVKNAIDSFLKYYEIIELGGYYAYLNELLADIITWNLNDNKQLSKLFNYLGNVNSNLLYYDKALEYYKKSLKMFEEIGDNAKIAASLNNIGILHSNWGKYDEALDYYKESLEIRKQINDNEGIAKNLNNIGNIYVKKKDYNNALKYYKKSLDIENKINNKIGASIVVNNIGNIYYYKKDYEQALKYYYNSLNIRKEIGDEASISDSFTNIGIVYEKLNKYDDALKYYKKSLEILEKMGDKNNIPTLLNSIGNIYSIKNNYNEALKQFKSSLKIREWIGDKVGIANSLSNIGLFYYNWGKYDSALEYYEKSLQIKKEIGDKAGIAALLGNIGTIYRDQGKYDSALEYYEKLLKIKAEIGDKVGIVTSLVNISETYVILEKYTEAIKYSNRALDIAKNLENNEIIAEILLNIGIIYGEQGQFNDAFSYLNSALSIAKEINYIKLVNNINEKIDLYSNKK